MKAFGELERGQLGALIDFLREKGVTHFSDDSLVIELGPLQAAPGTEAPKEDPRERRRKELEALQFAHLPRSQR